MILKRLFSEKLEAGGSMRQHLAKLLGWLDNLVELYYPLADDVAEAAILASLSKTFDNFVTTMDAWTDEKLTLHSVMEEWVKFGKPFVSESSRQQR